MKLSIFLTVAFTVLLSGCGRGDAPKFKDVDKARTADLESMTSQVIVADFGFDTVLIAGVHHIDGPDETGSMLYFCTEKGVTDHVWLIPAGFQTFRIGEEAIAYNIRYPQCRACPLTDIRALAKIP